MQVTNEHNWDNRNVYYMAAKLTDLPKGSYYNNLKPIIQISILDFNYPDDNQEFYQQIALINKKTGKVFSDKVAIHVLCLSQIENATPQDHSSGLYKWAKIFKATTWKELISLAENNPVLEGTVVTMAQLSAEDKIRQQCERQEKFERDRISAINFGIKAGLDKGKAEAKKNIQKLLSLMSEAGEDSLILEMAKDPSLLDKMYKKYHLD